MKRFLFTYLEREVFAFFILKSVFLLQNKPFFGLFKVKTKKCKGFCLGMSKTFAVKPTELLFIK